ncbi:MAG: hypothetical protein GF331_11890, partial [Chitinivibrionales bacterium]|nr:hypothetical protein [Chitinivibrionales bacterium]
MSPRTGLCLCALFATWWLVCAVSAASAYPRPFQFRTFTGTKSLYIAGPDRVLAYTPETESIRRIALGTAAQSTVHDIVDDDPVLWVLTSAGLFTLEKTSGTVQSVPFPGDSLPAGRLAADWDYVWLGGGRSVWQYDKLGMEWLEIPLPGGGADGCAMRGMFSDGETLYCVSTRGVYVLSIGDEKWREYPLDGITLSQSAVCHAGDDAVMLVDSGGIYRFVFDVRQWETVASGGGVLDVWQDGDRLLCLTDKRVFAYDLSSSYTKRLDIPGQQEGQSILAEGDTLFLVSARALVAYNLVDQSSETLTGPGSDGESPWLAAWRSGGTLVVLGQSRARLYDASMEQWRTIPVAGGDSGGRRFSWDDKGLRVQYGEGRQSVLSGRVEAYYTD